MKYIDNQGKKVLELRLELVKFSASRNPPHLLGSIHIGLAFFLTGVRFRFRFNFIFSTLLESDLLPFKSVIAGIKHLIFVGIVLGCVLLRILLKGRIPYQQVSIQCMNDNMLHIEFRAQPNLTDALW